MDNPGEWVLTFGKHKGSRIWTVPKQYLEWAYEAVTGKPEDHKAICAFLGHYVIPDSAKATAKSQKPKSKTPKTPARSPEIYATFDCSHLYDPNAEWPERQEWDGITAPWLDQNSGDDDLTGEFREMFQ